MNRNRLVLIAFLVAQAVIWAAYMATSVRGEDSAGIQDRLVFRGAVIRVGESVYIHTDASHTQSGITSISLVNDCRLAVTTDAVVGEQIIATIADEDEQLSKQGIAAGISGGASYFEVYLWRDGVKVCANDPTLGSTANLWITTMTALEAP